ncbi:hypothetical protein GN244_ATG00174 [Phytophthora infestans]|uniref:Uncharacterized protein n=1 Tax=Phytophthora infestans TaxID=4787 RepID=A0A833SX11_PHYIN|nr:hypothetical protein GN244_ATG00174 [Phytophthora infestans]
MAVVMSRSCSRSMRSSRISLRAMAKPFLITLEAPIRFRSSSESPVIIRGADEVIDSASPTGPTLASFTSESSRINSSSCWLRTCSSSTSLKTTKVSKTAGAVPDTIDRPRTSSQTSRMLCPSRSISWEWLASGHSTLVFQTQPHKNGHLLLTFLDVSVDKYEQVLASGRFSSAECESCATVKERERAAERALAAAEAVKREAQDPSIRQLHLHSLLHCT